MKKYIITQNHNHLPSLSKKIETFGFLSYQKRKEIEKELFQADIKSLNIDSYNILMYAIKKEIGFSSEVLHHLIINSDLNYTNKHGQNTLMVLLNNSHSRVTRSLTSEQLNYIIKNSNLSLKDNTGNTVLGDFFKSTLSSKKDIDISYIINNSKLPQLESSSVLISALRAANTLNSPIISRQDWETLIDRCDANNSFSRTRVLPLSIVVTSKKGVDLIGGYKNFEKLFEKTNLKYRDKKGLSLLSLIFKNNFPITKELLTSLLEAEKELDTRSSTPLHYLFTAGDKSNYRHIPQVLKYYSINDQDKGGNTPLMKAIEYDKLIFEKMIEDNQEKIDFSLTDNNGNNLLILYLKQSKNLYLKHGSSLNPDILNLLMDKCCLSVQNKLGQTAAVLASQNKKVPVNSLLKMIDGQKAVRFEDGTDSLAISYLKGGRVFDSTVFEKILEHSDCLIGDNYGRDVLYFSFVNEAIDCENLIKVVEKSDLGKIYYQYGQSSVLKHALNYPGNFAKLPPSLITKIINSAPYIDGNDKALAKKLDFLSFEQKKRINYIRFFKTIEYIKSIKILKKFTKKEPMLITPIVSDSVQLLTDYNTIDGFLYSERLNSIKNNLDLLTQSGLDVKDEKSTFEQVVSFAIKQHYINIVSNYTNNELIQTIELFESQLKDKINSHISEHEKSTRTLKKYLQNKI